MMKTVRFMGGLLPVLIFLAGVGCQRAEKKPHGLPYLGNTQTRLVREGGKLTEDTVYYTLPDFQFIDQDSQVVNKATLRGKIYVADFFFTTCPTICPKMSEQMLRVYNRFREDPRLEIVSHSIDPEFDTIPVLKDYALRLGVKDNKWHFVTGRKEDIYNMSKFYLVSAVEDPAAPGGFSHSGAFILVDTAFHLRGIYDGTKPEEVDHLIDGINLLIREMYGE